MAKRVQFILALIIFCGSMANAQMSNAASTMMESGSKLTVGGYGQIDYNQDLNPGFRELGNLDVHRMVMLFGYKFTDRTQFVSELEFEHVKEVYVEQAFLDHRILPFLSFRAGLMLVPMGLTNLYHEPTAFFGVERPVIDAAISPTTWREIGAGFAGTVSGAALKYEVYLMNGFSGFDGSAKFRGTDGFRKGRQKGAESFMSSPTFAGRISFYGLPGLQVGYSYYGGKSQSVLFDGLDKSNEIAWQEADSSRVGISMHGADMRYQRSGIYLKGQLYYVMLDNTSAYNAFGGTDLGSVMTGYYLEAGYDILSLFESEKKLIPFIRLEKYDTHAQTETGIEDNPAYNRTEIVTGLNYYLSEGAVLKADWQWMGDEVDRPDKTRFNLGLGVWF